MVSEIPVELLEGFEKKEVLILVLVEDGLRGDENVQ